MPTCLFLKIRDYVLEESNYPFHKVKKVCQLFFKVDNFCDVEIFPESHENVLSIHSPCKHNNIFKFFFLTLQVKYFRKNNISAHR